MPDLLVIVLLFPVIPLVILVAWIHWQLIKADRAYRQTFSEINPKDLP